MYEPGADGGPLDPREVDELSAAVELVGTGERVRNELRHVRGLMELMAKAPRRGAGEPPSSTWWQPGRLTVLATDDVVERGKDLADRLLFFRLLHQLRHRRTTPGTGTSTSTLVIAGADPLGRAPLESMARAPLP
ncbi:hypothetical protein [Streptomyces sp. NPDC020965]|uniref:hypothetical protein n=1 Tax=Streptomyces sp. NPDC020965 TaxID=3365105 RepID=UPI0037987BFA